MDRETVEVMSRVAGILAKTKSVVANKVDDHELYVQIRDLLGDCQEALAIHCDCAPIDLIAGKTDQIHANLEYSKKPVHQGA